MKKTIIILSAVALCATVACQKESAGVLENDNILTFTASYPQIEGAKTVLNSDKTVSWTATESFSVQNLTTTGAVFTNTATTPNVFSGVAPEQDTYYALSPASAVKSWNTASNKLFYGTFIIPKEQVATKGSWDPKASILFGMASNTDKKFDFKHVTGYIKFTIGASSGNIKKVEISSNVGIVGELEIRKTDDIRGTLVGEESTSVVLATSDGKAMEPGDYYVAVRARKHSSGFTLTFTNTGDKTAIKQVSGERTVTNGVVYNLGTVSGLDFPADGAPEIGTVTGGGIVSYIGSDYYLLMSLGEGDGKRWSAQGSPLSTKASGANSKTDGIANTQKYVQQASDEGKTVQNDLPIIYWVQNQGDGWYLPAIDELKNIWTAIGESTGGWDAFNDAITKASGTKIENIPAASYYYWSSTETEATKINGLKIEKDTGALSVSSFTKGPSSGYSGRLIRAVKKVSLAQ